MPTDDNPYAAPQSHGPPPGEASTKKAHTELKESGRAWLIVMTLGGSLIGQWLFGAVGMPGEADTLRVAGFIFGSFAGACAFLMLWYSRSRPDEDQLETDVVEEQSVEPAAQPDNPAPRYGFRLAHWRVSPSARQAMPPDSRIFGRSRPLSCPARLH